MATLILMNFKVINCREHLERERVYEIACSLDKLATPFNNCLIVTRQFEGGARKEEGHKGIDRGTITDLFFPSWCSARECLFSGLDDFCPCSKCLFVESLHGLEGVGVQWFHEEIKGWNFTAERSGAIMLDHPEGANFQHSKNLATLHSSHREMCTRKQFSIRITFLDSASKELRDFFLSKHGSIFCCRGKLKTGFGKHPLLNSIGSNWIWFFISLCKSTFSILGIENTRTKILSDEIAIFWTFRYSWSFRNALVFIQWNFACSLATKGSCASTLDDIKGWRHFHSMPKDPATLMLRKLENYDLESKTRNVSDEKLCNQRRNSAVNSFIYLQVFTDLTKFDITLQKSGLKNFFDSRSHFFVCFLQRRSQNYHGDRAKIMQMSLRNQGKFWEICLDLENAIQQLKWQRMVQNWTFWVILFLDGLFLWISRSSIARVAYFFDS